MVWSCVCALVCACVCVRASVCLCRSDYGPWLRVTLCRLSCTTSLILSINELRSTLLPRTPSINHNLSSVWPSMPTILPSPLQQWCTSSTCPAAAFSSNFSFLPLPHLALSLSRSAPVLFPGSFLNLLVHRLRSPFFLSLLHLCLTLLA